MSDWLIGPDFISDYLADYPSAGVTAWLLLSHLVLLIAVIRAYQWRLLRVATAGAIELIISFILYHPCRNAMYCLGVPMDTWRRADHIFVLNLFGCIGLHVLLFFLSTHGGRTFDMVAGHLVIAVAVLAVLIAPFTAASGGAMFLFIVVLAIIRLIWYLASGEGQCPGYYDNDDNTLYLLPDKDDLDHQNSKIHGAARRCQPYSVVWLVIAIVSGIAGLALYFINDDSPHQDTIGDAALHGSWHVLAGIAMLALVEATSYYLVQQLAARYDRIQHYQR